MNNVSIRCLTQIGVPMDEAMQIGRSLRPITTLCDESFSGRGGGFPGWLYIIDGCFIATVQVGAGQSLPIGVNGPGEWVGEEFLLSRRLNPMSLTAATDVHCLLLPKKAFRYAFEYLPTFSQTVAKTLSSRSSRLLEEIVAMRIQSLAMQAVVLMALIVETQVFPPHKGVPNSLPEHVSIPVSQDVLGRVCGISRTILSSYLKVLKRAGLVDVNYRGIKFLKIPMWLRFITQYRQRNIIQPPEDIDELADAILAIGHDLPISNDFRSTYTDNLE